MPRADQGIPGRVPRLARCPNCWCGIPAETEICDFCYASLTYVEGEIWTVSSIVCSHCGHEVRTSVVECPECRQPLIGTCPACGEDAVRSDGNGCSGCGAKRDEFYEICLRQERQRLRAREATTLRGTRLGLTLFWLAPFFFFLVGASHYLKGAAEAARGACVIGLFFTAFALLMTKLMLSSPPD